MSKPTQTCLVRLQKEYRNIFENPIQNTKIHVSQENLLKWHFCFSGLDDKRYKGGEYYGAIIMSSDYPFKPPSYYMYTPNGRFEVNKPICLSNSMFHNETWNPLWTMDAILRGLLSIFLDDDDEMQSTAVGHMKTPLKRKQRYATDSYQYNTKNNPNLTNFFRDDSK